MLDLRIPRAAAVLAAGLGCIAFAFHSTAGDAAAARTALPLAQEGQEAADEEEHDPLHESMEVLQGGMKGLRKMLSKPELKEDAVKLCGELQAAALVGFQNPPTPEEALEGDALVEYTADFRKRMLAVCTTLVDLEVALQKEDKDAAKALYKALGKHKKDGHDAYL
ncbi:MAG: hypothetical protein AAGB93_14045 [Planctomycetota bacterium]